MDDGYFQLVPIIFPKRAWKNITGKDAWYGKIGSSMETLTSQTSPAPPRVFKTLVSGFDAITNHIGLLIFPIGIDLIIWLAPRLGLKQIIENWLAIAFQTIPDAPDMNEMVQTAREIWLAIAERFNLLATLRSYPVGIPSLMASGFPMNTPNGVPDWIEINSIGMAFLFYLLITIIGLVMGALYFYMVADATLNNGVNWRSVFLAWPQASIQVIFLAVMWAALMFAVSIPAACGLLIAALFGIAPDSALIFIMGSLLLWLAFPLLFSAHGVFVYRQNAWSSVKKSVLITKMTLPTAMTFFMLVVLLSQSLNMLWWIAPEDSWLMLIGIAGHAFVATGLLAASFIYYRESDIWTEHIQEHIAKENIKSEQAI